MQIKGLILDRQDGLYASRLISRTPKRLRASRGYDYLVIRLRGKYGLMEIAGRIYREI